MRRRAALRILLHDRSTTAGAVIGVVAIIFLVGQQLAVLFGLFSYMSVLVDNAGADIWVVSRNTDNINSNGTLPTHYVDRLSGISEIEWAEPLVVGGGLLKRRDGKFQPVQVVGVAPPRLAGGPSRFFKGSLEALYEGDGITLDKLDQPEIGNPEVGDILEISGKTVRVAGLSLGIRGFSGTLVFANITTARNITGLSPDRCSNILVKLKPGVDAAAILPRLNELLPMGHAITAAALARRTRTFYIANTGIGTSFGFSTLIGLLVGVVIVTLTMYTMVLNRQREFAVLRALGARRRDISIIVLFQSVIIGLIGILIGFFLMAGFLAGTHGSRLPAFLPIWFAPAHALLTLLLCVVGSLLAVRRATSIEPASAFR